MMEEYACLPDKFPTYDYYWTKFVNLKMKSSGGNQTGYDFPLEFMNLWKMIMNELYFDTVATILEEEEKQQPITSPGEKDGEKKPLLLWRQVDLDYEKAKTFIDKFIF